jgi:hypothetical protein
MNGSSNDSTNGLHFLDPSWQVRRDDWYPDRTPDMKPTDAPPGYGAVTAVDSTGKVVMKCIFIQDRENHGHQQLCSVYDYVRDRCRGTTLNTLAGWQTKWSRSASCQRSSAANGGRSGD